MRYQNKWYAYCFVGLMMVSFVRARRQKTHGGGFTLVEVICSAAIAAIIFLALFRGISQGMSMIKTAREGLRANQIALQRTEGLRLEAWTASQLFNTNFVPTTFSDSFYPFGLNGSSSSTGTVYSGTMTITPSPFSGANVPLYNSKLALVKVTVSWQDNYQGRTNTFTQTNYTYVAQWGLQNYVYTH